MVRLQIRPFLLVCFFFGVVFWRFYFCNRGFAILFWFFVVFLYRVLFLRLQRLQFLRFLCILGVFRF